MPKYQVIDRIACWVDFHYEVEANSEQEALDKYGEDRGEFVKSEIDCNVDDIDGSVEVTRA